MPSTQAAPQPLIITRTFDAPRQLVWNAYSDPAHLRRWFAPKGFTMATCDLDLRPGGIFHYCMRSAEGFEMWGKWAFQEIKAPERMVNTVSFSDADRGVTRHPMSATWPLETLSTAVFAEQDGRTTITLEWTTVNATPEEQQTFDQSHDAMRKGLGGSYDQLEVYLREMKDDASTNLPPAPTRSSQADAEDRTLSTSRVIDLPPDQVFEAFANPERLARWWGPSGFTNTFHEFDFRPGGHWRFVMHGPDGTDYANHSVFDEIARPGRVVFRHLDPMHEFEMTITLEELDSKTRLNWRMLFATAEHCQRVEPFVIPANEQNLDRLEAELFNQSR